MSTISKRLGEKIQDNRRLKEQAKLDSNKIKEQDDKISALTNENEVLESKLDKWITLQNKGYTACAIENGIVVYAVEVKPYSTFTYTQEIPSEMGKSLYPKFPYLKLDQNGKMIKDIQKYNIYRSV